MGSAPDTSERLAKLEELHLASRQPLLGVGPFPDANSEWNLFRLEGSDEDFELWYVHDLGLDLIESEHFDERLTEFRHLREGVQHAHQIGERWSKIRLALSMTLFLPLMIVLWLLRMPTYRGSRYTLGHALVGFIAFLAIPGAIVSLFTQNWILLLFCVYWWTGAKVIETEAIDRGIYTG